METRTNEFKLDDLQINESGPIGELLSRIDNLQHRLNNLDRIAQETRVNIEESLTPIESD